LDGKTELIFDISNDGKEETSLVTGLFIKFDIEKREKPIEEVHVLGIYYISSIYHNSFGWCVNS